MNEEQIQQFDAKDDQGRTYTIQRFIQWKKVSGGLSGGDTAIPGRDRYQTADGKEVKRLEKGKYQVQPAGVVVRCDAPDAP
jgi:hypothetical protein